MIRVTQLKLPLGHPPEALKAALAKRLKLSSFEIKDFQVFKRAHDARSRTTILFIYTLDVTVKDEAALLARFEALSAAMGEPGSIGCIRMRNSDIVKLFDEVVPYTPVSITAA